MGQSRPLFVYFRSFLTISIQIEKSIDGVLGIRTQGRSMVGTDETKELWQPPNVRFPFVGGSEREKMTSSEQRIITTADFLSETLVSYLL